MQQFNDSSKGDFVGDGDATVSAFVGMSGFCAVVVAAVWPTQDCVYHFVHEVVYVGQFKFHVGVGDLDWKVVCDVVAECGYCAVVVGPAPFAKEVGEALDENLCARFLCIFEEQFFSGFFAFSVFAVFEAAFQCRLDAA